MIYIAGMGMVTSVGANSAMTTASVKANISAYALSDYDNHEDDPITMTQVPGDFFDALEPILENDIRSDSYQARIAMMAIAALRELSLEDTNTIPFIFGMPEGNTVSCNAQNVVHNIALNFPNFLDQNWCRVLLSGRAATIEAIQLAYDYLYRSDVPYVLIGGSDTYHSDALINKLDLDGRLLSPGNSDGFAPGEAAAFLLLTRRPELAQVHNGQIIGIHKPAVTTEPGHLYSDNAYQGDGLSSAFRLALENSNSDNTKKAISYIYSSMNGESYWARELGVACIRNANAMSKELIVIHPADCYGDVGAATGSLLVALAADNLYHNPQNRRHLVYCSSDTEKRSAVVVEAVNR
ncbi:hypothetical protein ACSV5M_03095 [Cellvibrio sp. ARAG 10.3]|uniref:hypothetical protein n=1 Tax=Cellvibrio sp. ARAG 10.3 TaxID=3451358 RepID=UPI003F45B5E9